MEFDVTNRRVTVAGAARSGIAAAGLATNIDKICAFVCHAKAGLDGLLRIKQAAAV